MLMKWFDYNNKFFQELFSCGSITHILHKITKERKLINWLVEIYSFGGGERTPNSIIIDEYAKVFNINPFQILSKIRWILIWPKMMAALFGVEELFNYIELQELSFSLVVVSIFIEWKTKYANWNVCVWNGNIFP